MTRGYQFAQVSAGESHTCGVTTGNVAYCWGDGSSGKLGTGNTNSQLEPWPVFTELAFVQISAGAEHSCGVTADNDAYCWGEGADGRLGTGNEVSIFEPRLVSGGHAFARVDGRRQALLRRHRER